MRKQYAKMVRFTLNQEQEIISLYNDGYGCVNLGKLFGVSSSRILLILNKYNIKRNGNKFSNISSNKDKEKMIQMYSEGMTLQEVGDKFGVYENTVKCIINNRGVKCRKTKDVLKIPINEDFFMIKSKELAYFYGFVLGDGTYTIHNKIPRIKIGVHIQDIFILETFSKWTNIDRSHLYFYKHKKLVEFRIRDNILKKNRKYWGVIQNKTYNPIIPQIKDKELLKSFLIGLIDADGHITYEYGKGGQFQLVGNKKIMKWFIKTIKNLGYCGAIKEYAKPDKIWSRVCISRKKDVVELAKILDAENCPFLFQRKWGNVIAAIKNTKNIINN